MTTMFFLVRHAAHELVDRVLCGRMPGVNLGEEGRAQAHRVAKRLARDRGIGGALIGPSSYFMKSPPQQFTDSEARERTISFINGEDETTH